MILQNLCNTSITKIHEAFIDAFSEYEVKIDMPIEKLKEMLLTRDYNPSLSIGYFEEDQLLGFILVGYRKIDKKKYCYDIATGVIKECQNMHIGDILLKELKKSIETNNIDQFQLEVLEHNIAARKLYENNGFSITRKLRCYEKELGNTITNRILYTVSCDNKTLSSIDEIEYASFRPTWQNSFRTYYKNISTYYLMSFHENNIIVGYGIIHKERGDILQIGIREDYRDRGLEEMFIQEIASRVGKNKVRLLNIEDNSYMQNKLDENKYCNTINQYEMVYANRK